MRNKVQELLDFLTRPRRERTTIEDTINDYFEARKMAFEIKKALIIASGEHLPKSSS